MSKLTIGTNVEYIGENENLKNKIGHIDGYDAGKYRVSFEKKETNGIAYTCYCIDAENLMPHM